MPDGSSTPLTGDITVRATEFAAGGPEPLPGTMPGNVAPDLRRRVHGRRGGRRRRAVGRVLGAGHQLHGQLHRRARRQRRADRVLRPPERRVGPVAQRPRDQDHRDHRRQGRARRRQDAGRRHRHRAVATSASPTPSARRSPASTTAGTELWRIPIMHFTPWDHNWPYGPPPGAQPPKLKDFVWKDPNDPCNQQGSIIACESQNLGEEIAVTGTPFNLRYDSSRQPGYHVNDTLEIPITGGTIPERLKGIEVDGRHRRPRVQEALVRPELPDDGREHLPGLRPDRAQPVVERRVGRQGRLRARGDWPAGRDRQGDLRLRVQLLPDRGRLRERRSAPTRTASSSSTAPSTAAASTRAWTR